MRLVIGIVLLTFLLLLGGFAAQAQTPLQLSWNRVYYALFGSSAQCVEALSNGGYLLGTSNRGLMKVDSLGNPVWLYQYAITTFDGDVNDIVPLPCGDYIAVLGGGLLRLNNAGDTVRTLPLNLPGAIAWSACLLEDDGILVSGAVDVVHDGDFFLAKFDSSGTRCWTQVYTVGGRLHGGDLCLLSDGGALIAGTSAWNTNANLDGMFVVRTDSAGNMLWNRLYRGRLQSFCQRVMPVPSGGFLLAGKDSYDGFWTTNVNMRLVRITNDGDTLWTRVYALADTGTSAADIEVDSAGFTLVGAACPAPTVGHPRGVHILRVDTSGTPLWHMTSLANWWGASSSCRTSYGGLTVCGSIVETQMLIPSLAHFSPASNAGTGPVEYLPTPTAFTLSAFPNPFNPTTTITFDLPQTQPVRLVVYDLLGREVAMLLNAPQSAGTHTVHFNASDLPSGLYFARFHSSTYTATQKLLLLK